MEKRDNTSRFRIDSREVGALVQIAPIAGQRKIRWIIVAAMLPGDNVLDVKGRRRHRRLRKMTVLASLTGPVMNQLSNGRVH
jgi:hypothetical protein